MTDRIHGLTVVLDKDYRDDDVEKIVEAIKMVRGVLSVSLHVTDIGDYSARERVRAELGSKILKVVYPKTGA